MHCQKSIAAMHIVEFVMKGVKIQGKLLRLCVDQILNFGEVPRSWYPSDQALNIEP
jgi:hypothetical protein